MPLPSRRRGHGRPRSRRRYGCLVRAAAEALEPRWLLAFSAIGPEFAVNETAANEQSAPAVASDADGDVVVAWQSQGQDGFGFAVYARRYSAGGAALGGEFRVNSYTNGDQSDPAVAADADGDFVVVWSSFEQDHSNAGVYAQRYDATGAPRGNEFRVNQTTAGAQSLPSVAMDADGDFVVAWTSNLQDGSYLGVYARRYAASGEPRGGEFPVNSRTVSQQARPSAAMDADGDFVIAWQSYGQEDPVSGFHYGVYAKRYNAAGVEQARPGGVPAGDGNEFRVNASTDANQRFADVAMDYSGDFFVAWTSYHAGGDSDGGVFAQRFTAAGALAGGEFRVNTSTVNTQKNPDVSVDADGDFLIAWTSTAQDGSLYGSYAKRYSAAGAELPPPAGAPAVLGNEFRANTYTDSSQRLPALAVDADGDAVIAWQSYGQDAPNTFGIYSQRYDESADTAAPIVSGLVAGNDVRPGERLVQSVTSLTVLFSENLSTAGGSAGANSATNPANYRLTRDGNDVSSLITGVSFSFNAATRKHEAVLTLSSPLPDGTYVLSVSQNLRDPAGNPLDGNLDGARGDGDAEVSFVVRGVLPTGPEFRVNSFVNGSQLRPSVAVDADGDFVVVWADYTQGATAPDIYAQRFNAAGQPQAGEFRVNSTTAGNQYGPDVAMDAAGNFVVVWESNPQDGDGRGVYAKRYSAADGEMPPPAGTVAGQGNEFRVTSATIGDQIQPSVAVAPDGDFVVAWQGPDGGGDGVYARLFTAAAGGAARGLEFRVNTSTAGIQYDPAPAMDAAGNFVVAWYSSDGSDYGVYAKRYSAAGLELPPPPTVPRTGNEFRVNTFTAGRQFIPAAAMDVEGNFVIAWDSTGQDGAGRGIYAKRYSSLGAELPPPTGVTPGDGNEFRTSTVTAGNQSNPSIGIDADGDFAIAWTDDGARDGAGTAAFARRYGADGAAQGGDSQVNTYIVSNQAARDLAMDDDGDFIIAWASYGQDAPPDLNPGVYAQRYGPNLPPTTVGIPAVTVQQDEADTVVNLWDAFSDPNTADNTLTFSVVGNTNPSVFSATPVSNAAGILTLNYTAGQNGQAVLTVRATDPGGLFVDTSFTVTVTPDSSAAPRVAAVFVDSTAWTAAFRTHLQNTGLGTSALGFRISAGADQLLALPFANFNGVRVQFSEHVSVDQPDLSVRGALVGSYPTNAFTYEPATFVATWNLPANVGRDKVMLDLDGDAPNGVTDGTNRLDGEWANGADSFPSGNGTTGGDFRFQLNVLPGDADGNGSVTVADVGIIATNFGAVPAGPRQGDFNGDGSVTVADVGILATSFGQTLPAGTPTVVVARPAPASAPAPVIVAAVDTRPAARRSSNSIRGIILA